MIKFSFSGTSHGEGYSGTISGLPQGFVFDTEFVNNQLQLRKQGFGRSARQCYSDKVVFDGFADKVTVCGDVHFCVANDSANKQPRQEITALRSGHTDIVGQARFSNMSARQISEISSARNSVCYVVLGAICKQLLQQKSILTYSFTQQIGANVCKTAFVPNVTDTKDFFAELRCPSRAVTKSIKKDIELCRQKGDSLGGVAVVVATGVPMGVGEILPYDRRLDAQISANLVGIPAVKGIEFGLGHAYAKLNGTQVVDKTELKDSQIVYSTNNCGGIVGGISTGGDIVCKLIVKPVPTVLGAIAIDSVSGQLVAQHYERADTCVVPNVGIIAENILAYVIANQMIEQDLL